jgi:exopolysaccharide/PEP-CTERM locus tyrosine autokinase
MPALEPPTRQVTVDLAALRTAGYLPEQLLDRRFADHYRQIKRPLIEAALAGDPQKRLILVSSALPGDGKTFTCVNLALSMAHERDLSVLLADGDAPRARLTGLLGMRGEPGLLNALADESLDVESLIVGTNVRGLQLLPLGKFMENATELLASARMKQIATSLVSRDPRRLVVFDSAPLLVSSEARVLSRLPGQVVLVVRSGKTPVQAITEALGYLDQNRFRGVILNHTPLREGGGYYGDYGAGAEEKSHSTAP